MRALHGQDVESTNKKQRLGFVVSSARQCRYIDALLDRLQDQGVIELSVLVVLRGGTEPLQSKEYRSAASWLATGLLAVETHALRFLAKSVGGVRRRASQLRRGRVDLGPRFKHRVDLVASSFGSPAADFSHREAMEALDVVILLHEGNPTISSFGLDCWDVIQWEVGSSPAVFPELVGFREVIQRLDQTPVRLYRLGPDGLRTPLLCALNRTKKLFSLNQAAAWDRLASLLIAHLQSPTYTPLHHDTVSAPTSLERAASASSSIPELMTYPLRLLGRGCELAARQIGGKRNWSIAIFQRSGPGPFSGIPQKIQPAPAGTYYADPFLYFHRPTSTNYCFVEEFDKRSGKAHIAVLRQEQQEWSRIGIALNAPFHLSFPFVFEYGTDLYMCPEMCGSGQIGIYKCEGFPLQWARCATLMSGVSATDTMLLQHDARWWMLTNLDRAALPDHQNELHVFHADSPISDNWTPINTNPVKLDCHGARNGGFTELGGRLFRFGQVQTFESYGRGLRMYEVTDLAVSCYRERFVMDVSLPFQCEGVGMHTYSASPGFFAIDTLGAR